jgi:hypothetical protein
VLSVSQAFSAQAQSTVGDGEAIATMVFNALVKIQAQRPEWIQERYRSIALGNQREKIVQFLQANIDQQTSGQSITAEAQTQGIRQCLAKMLEPAFFQTPTYQRLMAAVLAKVSSPLSQAEATQGNPPVAPAITAIENRRESPPPLTLANVAILLLDAENLDLPATAEQWLAETCHHPIRLKFAFGDWKRLGSRDQDLHGRGYHLIHVPSGKNHADSKMTVIGSSILVHLPSIKEAIVCSNDNDLQDLRNTLHFQGLRVSWLQRHEQSLTLTHCHTQQTELFQLPPPPQFPRQEEGVDFVKDYLKAQPDQQTYFTSLTLEFSNTFNIPMTAFVKTYQLGKTPKDFLQKSPDFKVFHQPGDPRLYVALVIQADNQLTEPLTEFNLKKLKAVTVGITKRLLQEQKVELISVSSLASTFHRQHGQAMTAVLKQLSQSQKIPSFLQTCQGIKAEKRDSQWVVSLETSSQNLETD